MSFGSQVILIVEDHELTIALLIETLSRAFPLRSFQVARSVGETYQSYFRTFPVLVVMDIGLPDGSGLDATRQILVSDSAACIVVHSSNDEEHFRTAAIEAGARAFVSKRSPLDLVCVIEELLAG